MSGAAAPVADPISPLDEHDDRPSAKTLIDEHRSIIDEARRELATDPLFEATKHDELWILRFLLSHKLDAKLAVEAAKTTLAFRRQHKLDEQDIRFKPVSKDHENEYVRQHQAFCHEGAVQFVVPDTKRGVIGFLHFAGIDQHAMVKHLDKSSWLPALCYISEFSFQWTDYVTRTTGRLTKSVRLLDTRGFAMKYICYEGIKRDGEAMNVMEDCYPQMLQGIFVCNPVLSVSLCLYLVCLDVTV